MRVRDRLLEHPAVYGAWQAPFAAQKFAPVDRWLRQHEVRRVLDVGCGAGTNARRFKGIEYVGLDINERYLEVARTRFPGTFVQARPSVEVARPWRAATFTSWSSYYRRTNRSRG